MQTEAWINKEVQFAGIVSEIPVSLDPSSRSEILKMIDKGKRDNCLASTARIPCGNTLKISMSMIRIFSADNHQDILLHIPVHHVAAVSYIKEYDQHILSIKFGDVAGKLHSPDEHISCNLAILYCDSRAAAEEVCSFVDVCFQTLYTDATMNSFDKTLLDGNSTLRSENSWNVGKRPSWYGRNSQVPSLPQFGTLSSTLGFLSGSVSCIGSNDTTSSRTASSRLTRESSDNDVVSTANETRNLSANDVIIDYMNKLYTKLTAPEVQEFAMLLRAWQMDSSFSDFFQKVLALYGPERKYLLVGMRPFIPAKDLPFFEHHLQVYGCNDNDSNSSECLSDEGWAVLDVHKANCESSSVLMDGYELVDRGSPVEETGSNHSVSMS